MNGQSLNITAEKLAQLQAIFPEVFTEGQVDFTRLREVLGEYLADPKEHYELTWAGKMEARREIQKQTSATLIPEIEGSVNFEASSHIFIEGENLEVLRILQRSYFGKIKMIYIDPPYNTGNDSFVYPDDYAERQEEYNKRTGKTNGDGYLNKQDLWRKNSKENGQFHSVWLSMIYPRLYLARNLLRDDGVIFVSIDDNEVANLRLLMDEIFGEENFIALFPWKKRTAKSDVPFGVSQDYEWILGYTRGEFGAGIGYERKYYQTDDFPRDRWRLSDLTTQRSATERPNSAFDMIDPKTNKIYPFNPQRVWGVTKNTFKEYYEKGKIVFPDDYDFLSITTPYYRVFESEDQAKSLKKYGKEDVMKTVSTDLPKKVGMSEDGNKEIVKLFGSKIFSFPKPIELIKYLLLITNDHQNSIVLDFFAGSGTTAQAVLELNEEDGGNRQFICVQMPEILEASSEAYKVGYRTIADICKARIQKVIEKINTTRSETLNLQGERSLLGFKSFQLAPSNFKQWRGDLRTPEAILEQLSAFIQSEKADSEETKMLYELLLKAGFELTTKIVETEINHQKIYFTEDNRMLFFFQDYNSEIEAFIHQQKPQKVVCLDRVFQGNDQALTNFQLKLQEISIELTII